MYFVIRGEFCIMGGLKIMSDGQSETVNKIPRHVSFAQLVDIVECRLQPSEHARAQAHVSACPRCAEQVAWLKRLIGLMLEDDFEDPPAAIADKLLRMFRSRSLSSSTRLQFSTTGLGPERLRDHRARPFEEMADGS